MFKRPLISTRGGVGMSKNLENKKLIVSEIKEKLEKSNALLLEIGRAHV